MTSTMQKQNLQTLKGFRDFLPPEKRARDLVMAKIKTTFERFGFEPLETPTLEYAELLLGKYGAEADKLVYSFEDRGGRQVALRYDQTVPTARVLSQYQNELGKGFRRYQIQPVFRAEKPQKGRYRELIQCDADIFGSTASIADAEILAVYYFIYRDLGLTDLVIEFNDREILISNLMPYATQDLTVFSIIQSIDKLDKQTVEEVATELVAKGLSAINANKALTSIQQVNPSPNLVNILNVAQELGIPQENLKFNPTLARGLDYYTGMIFEGKIPGESGSVGGGGRYDKLIESLGGPNIPAVGFGLGFDRTVEVLESRNLISVITLTQVLVTIFSPDLQGESLKVAQSLRSAGINTELYPDPSDKLDKQFKYADKKSIPYAIVIGQDEVDKNVVTLKNLVTHEQTTLLISEAISNLKI
ncbi:histidine--tRNA ligase [Candidatus Collierbacteria bacterium CG10_big_fil_rev_8_21_14_0_10_44_9]|uniref:Histidine--tRNA ligase n=1 Tax=Candidatus Collierbacteria bacterium CG10_big_fil_rev_8_21_14_0_10_44_9 TaxID=1974535 RepID=A0A2H0VIH5_9BACT|nr:MAG: histidine--tRNA ligase [Candidatus Collierbacteria bacterium CG10_big_fil_rev_8_21_14_0_10_44_9]